MYQLTVKSGLTRGASWPITTKPICIGRGQDCSIRIKDPLASRRHCELVLTDSKIYLSDNESRNGTLVNGHVLREAFLSAGDEITVGHVVFLVTETHAAPALSAPSDNTTFSLGEKEACYLSEDLHNDFHQGNLRNVRDLCLLFQWSRSFSRAETQADLVFALEQALRDRLNPPYLWIGMDGGDGTAFEMEVEHRAAGLPPIDPPLRLMRQAAEESRGFLMPHREGRGEHAAFHFSLAVPLVYQGTNIGAFAACSPSLERVYDETDLHFAVSLAHMAAPFFIALARNSELAGEVQRLRAAKTEAASLVGSSRQMKQVRESAEHVAGTDLPVLIVGETGTGKELAATLVHSFSKRSGGPLTTVNCAAIPRDLFESEVFGHERGAFTGAHARRIGLIEQADGGTLFLDEVGDLSLENQARLLRALENRRFRRLGGEKDIEVSFRLISASNKPLEAMVAAQTFRRDFYHRLRGVELSIPPLRARASDIEELADFFFQQARIHAKRPLRGFTPGALSFLSEHNWPGNVRELKYTVNAAVATAKGECLTDDDLKRLIAGQYGETVLLPLAEVEREHILRVLEKCNNKVLHAAKVLGISKTMLYKRLAEYDAGGLCKDGR